MFDISREKKKLLTLVSKFETVFFFNDIIKSIQNVTKKEYSPA
jgi:hypothetical protein